MAKCHTPIPATQDEAGEVTLRQTRTSAIFEDGEYLELACGKCPGCRTTRVRSWAIRSYHEGLTNTRPVSNTEVPNGIFLTLTYDDEHLVDVEGNPTDVENASLYLPHFQNFCKKLRRDYGSIRFLHCGEYGAECGRPHYHACLFGIDFHWDRVLIKQNGDEITWISPSLLDAWPHGYSEFSPLNFATAAYTAGYVMKKARTQALDDLRINYDSSSKSWRSKKLEYITMSRNPGLGTNWFERYWKDVYPRDLVTINGKNYRPPKFYDNLLLQVRPDVHSQVMEQRRQHQEQQGPTYDNELEARGRNFAAQTKLLKKDRQ